MTTPRCPFCNAQGLDLLKIEQTALFQVVCCGQCGAIHGILPLAAALVEATNDLPQEEKTAWAEAPKQARAISDQYDDLTVTELEEVVSKFIGQSHITLTPEQIAQLFVVADNQAVSPFCPQHKNPMVKLIIPDGLSKKGQSIWICRQYRTCHQWQVDTSVTHGRSQPKTTPSEQLLPKPGPIKSSQKPLNEDRIGAILNVRGGYAHLAFDPPLCPKCKINMVEEKVPEGHKEAGQFFWKCPNFQTCKQWLPIKS
ncbi:MAG: hypothetical protein DPW09_19835 [Anaerolineae bacterium]|nr:hypothetical protein [Anaerolineales bacterium]MCQ3975693.1 hypothetical protein [Anaerolineae bacterium]